MFNIMKQSGKEEAYVTEYVADTIADVTNLPTDKCSPGSVCFVVATSQVYMLNNNKEWKEI